MTTSTISRSELRDDLQEVMKTARFQAKWGWSGYGDICEVHVSYVDGEESDGDQTPGELGVLLQISGVEKGEPTEFVDALRQSIDRISRESRSSATKQWRHRIDNYAELAARRYDNRDLDGWDFCIETKDQASPFVHDATRRGWATLSNVSPSSEIVIGVRDVLVSTPEAKEIKAQTTSEAASPTTDSESEKPPGNLVALGSAEKRARQFRTWSLAGGLAVLLSIAAFSFSVWDVNSDISTPQAATFDHTPPTALFDTTGVSPMKGDAFTLFVGDEFTFGPQHPHPLHYQWLLQIDNAVWRVACVSEKDAFFSVISDVSSHYGLYEYYVIVTSDHTTPGFPESCEGVKARLPALLNRDEITQLQKVKPGQEGEEIVLQILRDSLHNEFQESKFSFRVFRFPYQRQTR